MSSAQSYTLADKMPYAPLENITLEQALNLAAQNRSDLKAAEAQLRAAEFARKAAVAEHYPTLGVAADYGVIGVNPAKFAWNVRRKRATPFSHLVGRAHAW